MLTLLMLFAVIQDSPAQEIKAPKLQEEINSRCKEDQDARFAFINFMKKTQTKTRKVDGKTVFETPPDQAAELQNLMKAMQDIDKKNLARMKEVVQEHGWPGKSLIGEQGAHNAWLLVQHADTDRDFQELCLEKMNALPHGEVAAVDVAYLTDRVLVGRGKPQKYGTQTKVENGKATPLPIDDEAHVDQRRKALGLEPLAAYLQQVEKMYGGSTSEGADRAKDEKPPG